MEDEAPTAILGSSSSAKTMADGTLRVSIDIMPGDAVAAFTLFGSPGSAVALARISDNVALAHGQPGREETPEKKYGEYARALKLSGFFRTPEVWKAVGSDKQYLNWVKRMPSAISAEFSEHHDDGGAYCVPAHVRRVEHGSGTGIKPEYSAIPLTHEEHQLSHQKGDSAIGDEEWWAKKRIEYVQGWCWETLKDHLGFDSWASTPPSYLRDWAQEHDLLRYLPNVYKIIHDDGQDTSEG